MKWSTVAVGLTIFGLIGISIILLFQQLTTTNENDYYLLKEITEAAMVDSIDISYYRETGELKIVREKFVENFTRRFAESTLIIGTKYTIKFFDIMEEPPKVSVRIDTGLENYKIYNTSGNYNVVNELTGIFEYVPKQNTTNNNDDDESKNSIIFDKSKYKDTTKKKVEAVVKTKTFNYYAIIKKDKNNRAYNYDKILELNIPDELISGKYKNQIINSVSYEKMSNFNQAIINEAILKRDINYINADNDYNFYLPLEKVTNNVYNDNSNIVRLCERRLSVKELSMIDPDCYEEGKNKINIQMNSNENKEYAIVKLTVIWQYDEYEYVS